MREAELESDKGKLHNELEAHAQKVNNILKAVNIKD